jgi:hypothetical protein
MNVVYVVHVVNKSSGGLFVPNGKGIEIIHRIHDAGYLREFDAPHHLNLPRLTIEMNPVHSAAFDYRGGLGIILELRITSNRSVRIQDFGDLELQERPCNVVWWAIEKLLDVYKFDGGPEYPRDVVLNHRIGVAVKPGQPLGGVLLGHSATRIPPQYTHGFKLPLILSILDGFDTLHSAQLHVQVDEHLCSNTRRPSLSSLNGPRSGNKVDPVDELRTPLPRKREQVDMEVTELRAAERQAPGPARVWPKSAKRVTGRDPRTRKL